MTPRSILVVTDFSPCGNHALSRTALLAAQHGAALRLVYLAYPAEAPPEDAATRLAHHALQLTQRHGIRASAVSRLCFTVDDLLPEVRHADLVVWGTARVSGLRAFFVGQPVERLLRAARRPVLVVRRDAAHDYRSLIVAVDFSPTSQALVDVGLALARPARAELFHAVSTANEGKLRQAEVSPAAIKAYRDACRRHAQDRVLRLTDSYDARRNRVRSAVGHGDPARQTVVQQQNSGAELIVVARGDEARRRRAGRAQGPGRCARAARSSQSGGGVRARTGTRPQRPAVLRLECRGHGPLGDRHEIRAILALTDFLPQGQLGVLRDGLRRAWVRAAGPSAPDVATRAGGPRHAHAQLTVVGRHRRSNCIGDALCRSAAGHVLRRSSGDVLLVPHDLRLQAPIAATD